MDNNWKEIIRKDLFERQDTGYGDFQSKLMPTVPRERIIGIRTPVLKKYVKDLLKNDTIEIDDFLHDLPHYYYEENNLHMLIVMQIKDYDRALSLIEDFLPYIDNWATCDSGDASALFQVSLLPSSSTLKDEGYQLKVTDSKVTTQGCSMSF